MSEKHYKDISLVIDVWVENVLVNLIDFQAILKSSVDLRKPSKEDFQQPLRLKWLTARLSAIPSVTWKGKGNSTNE